MTRVHIQSGDHLKTGDTEPDLVVTLIKDNDNPKDLSSGSPEVNFYLSEPNEDGLEVDDSTAGNVSISDGANGEVTYSWQSGDTDRSGRFNAEFEVVDGSDQSTYPNAGTFKIQITEGLN